jgi:hypothetical protein
MSEGKLTKDEPDDPQHLPAPAAGSLGTSGRDDQERGDTVSGLGLTPSGSGAQLRPGQNPEVAEEGRGPTPGNRLTAEDFEQTPGKSDSSEKEA